MDIKDIKWKIKHIPEEDNEMIIEKPYEQLKAIKYKMRELSRDLADLQIIVDNMQDCIVNNLEISVDDLQRKLDGRVKAEDFNALFIDKED